MKKLVLALGLCLLPSLAWAQNPTCPTRPVGDNTNACASTAFIQNTLAAGIPLAHTHIFVGNSSNFAIDFGTLATFSDNGTLTLAPTPASMNQGLNVTQTSPTSGGIATNFATFNKIVVNSQIDNSSATGFSNGAPNNWMSGLLLQYTTQGTNTANFHSGFMGQYLIPAATSTPTGYGVVGIGYINAINSRAGAGVGGTNSYAICDTTCGIGIIMGAEAEVGIRTGGVATKRAGILIDSIGLIQATSLDAAIMVTTFTGWNGSTSAGAFKNLVAFTSDGVVTGSGTPLDTTGRFFISDAAMTVDSIFCMSTACTGGSNLTVNGYILAFPNVLMLGSGLTTLGSGNAPDAALTVNNNTGATVAPTLNTAIHLVGADSATITQTFDSYNSVSVLVARAASGTRGAKIALAANSNMFDVGTQSWDGSAYATNALIIFRSLNLQSGTDHSSVMQFQTVASGSTTLTTNMQLWGSGGLSVGNANVATDPGAGVVLATGVTAATMAGGSAAGSTLALKGTTNGSPSGDTITLTDAGQVATFLTPTTTVSGFKINQNANASPNFKSLSGATLISLDTANAGWNIQTYAGIGLNQFYRANGTGASPSKLLSGDVIGGLIAGGWDNSGVFSGPQGILRFKTAEDWNGTTNRGTTAEILTTPAASGTLTLATTFFASGGLAIGSTISDPGQGGLYVSGATITLNGLGTDATHTDRSVCQDTTSKSLFFGSGAAGICLGTSSERFKPYIADLDVGIEQIEGLRAVKYTLDAAHGDPDKILYGFTAEQGGQVLPLLTGRDVQGRPQTFDYIGVVPVLVRAVQQLKADNDNLREQLRVHGGQR